MSRLRKGAALLALAGCLLVAVPAVAGPRLEQAGPMVSTERVETESGGGFLGWLWRALLGVVANSGATLANDGRG